MRLEFGDRRDEILPGRIYFACDQPVNAEFSGTFKAKID
jgi:hypothetical protein